MPAVADGNLYSIGTRPKVGIMHVVQGSTALGEFMAGCMQDINSKLWRNAKDIGLSDWWSV